MSQSRVDQHDVTGDGGSDNMMSLVMVAGTLGFHIECPIRGQIFLMFYMRALCMNVMIVRWFVQILYEAVKPG